MKQGCIGDVAFFVSPSEVHTWRNMERKRSINFGEHAVLEGVPRLQHTGRALDTMTLAVVMDSSLPEATPCGQRIEALRALAATGEEQPLVFGSQYQGEWVITAVSVTARVMQGETILRADVALELKEYN